MADELLEWYFCTKTAGQEKQAKQWAKLLYSTHGGHVESWTVRQKGIKPGAKPIGVHGYIPKSRMAGLVAELKAAAITVSIVHNFKPIFGTYSF